MSEFDHKAREWDNNHSHWERARTVADALLDMVPLTPGMKALEFGAGTGILSFALAGYSGEITMMDNSPEMVKVMEEKVAESGRTNMKIHFGSLGEGTFSRDYFDMVYNLMVMHHVEDISLMVKQFHRILRPGGFLAIADLYSEDGSFHKESFTGHHGFDPEILQQELEKAGFEHRETRPCYINKKEIDGVMREFPVFIMVARKPEPGADPRKAGTEILCPAAGQQGKRQKII